MAAVGSRAEAMVVRCGAQPCMGREHGGVGWAVVVLEEEERGVRANKGLAASRRSVRPRPKTTKARSDCHSAVVRESSPQVQACTGVQVRCGSGDN